MLKLLEYNWRVDKSNNTANSNIPYTKLSDNSQKDKQKNESQCKNFMNKCSSNTFSLPERQNYKRF